MTAVVAQRKRDIVAEVEESVSIAVAREGTAVAAGDLISARDVIGAWKRMATVVRLLLLRWERNISYTTLGSIVVE
jgi:hypothetical protein